MGAKVTADYMKNNSSSDTLYGANLGFGLTKDISATAEYFKNNENSAKAMAYGVKFDKIGLSATYRDVEAGAFSPFSTMVTSTTTQYDALKDGFKGMEYQYDHNIDKNAVFTVKYQDFENKSGVKLNGRTSAAVNVKF